METTGQRGPNAQYDAPVLTIFLQPIEKIKPTNFYPCTIQPLLCFLYFSLTPECYDSYEAESFLS